MTSPIALYATSEPGPAISSSDAWRKLERDFLALVRAKLEFGAILINGQFEVVGGIGVKPTEPYVSLMGIPGQGERHSGVKVKIIPG